MRKQSLRKCERTRIALKATKKEEKKKTNSTKRHSKRDREVPAFPRSIQWLSKMSKSRIIGFIFHLLKFPRSRKETAKLQRNTQYHVVLQINLKKTQKQMQVIIFVASEIPVNVSTICSSATSEGVNRCKRGKRMRKNKRLERTTWNIYEVLVFGQLHFHLLLSFTLCFSRTLAALRWIVAYSCPDFISNIRVDCCVRCRPHLIFAYSPKRVVDK